MGIPGVEEYDHSELTSSRLEEAFEHGWFKIFTPRALGGRELTLLEGISELREAARRFGSLGWCANLGSGAAYFAPSFSLDVGREIYGQSRSVVAGSGQTSSASGRRLTSTRYIIDGKWAFCTGASHATFFTVSVDIPGEGIRSFAVPASKIEIFERDELFGLRGTSSHTISLAPYEVEERYAFDIGKVVTDYCYPLHSIPFIPFAQFCMAASMIGIFQCFCDVALHELGLERCAPSLARCESVVEGSSSRLGRLAEVFWEGASKYELPNESLRGELCQTVNEIRGAIMQQALALFHSGGMRMIDVRNPAHWAFRDLLTAGQHFLLDGREKPQAS